MHSEQDYAKLNNAVYVVLWFGFKLQMDDGLFSRIVSCLPSPFTDADIVKCASEHAWLLAGKPDVVKYQLAERVAYAASVLATFQALPNEDRINTQ